MKKIINYIVYNIKTSKIYIFFIILCVYILAMMVELMNCNKQYNIYDHIITVLSYLPLFYFLFATYILMIYKVLKKGLFYNYISVRFNNASQPYNANILTCLIFAIGFITFVILICLLSGSFMNFDNSWSQYGVCNFNAGLNLSTDANRINLILNNISPMEYTIIISLFCTLYLFTLSIILILFNMLIKKPVISLLLVVMISTTNSIGLFDSCVLRKFTFPNNIYILNADINEIIKGSYITSRFTYWIVLIIVLYFIGFIISKKKDCIYEK